ncbi:MAG: dihydrofolate reductase [Chloroflexota bacterium]
MYISLIVAADEQNGIGQDGQLPWHLPDDLKRFKQLTLGHHLIVGRKTFESIGKALPGRTTIVVTRQAGYRPEGALEAPHVLVAPGVTAALDMARCRGEGEAFCCGGGEVYRQMLPLADCVYLTRVCATVPADVTFPTLTESEWEVTESTRHPADEKHRYAFVFLRYRRIKNA